MRKLTVYGIGLLCLLFGTAPMMATDVASVQVGSDPAVTYDDFSAAWTDAMKVQEATITLLADITRTEYITYWPNKAHARHTLDLNGCTITENTTDRVLYVYRDDAKLTVTDNSAAGNGCLYKKQATDDKTISTVLVGKGEFELKGGKLYCENTADKTDCPPAVALNSQHSSSAKINVTGGTVEAVSTDAVIGICSAVPTTVSGGLIKATTTKYTNARAYCQVASTGTISGGTIEARAIGTGTLCSAVSVEASIDTLATPVVTYDSELTITDGTFFSESENNNVRGVLVSALVRKVGEEIKRAKGTLNIEGGNFTVRCVSSEASQVFAGIANGVRLFDKATPHNMIGEEKGELNISGGNFLVDTRDAEGHYVDNADNIDILRCWGTLNVSGGTFTIYQHNNAVGVAVYRNKATISGNPVFHIHCASNARGISAGPWNHASYCDADPANNLAEVEVSGGTFVVQCDSESGNSIAVWANGGVSVASASGDAGYAMSAKITIHDGEFTAIHPISTSSRAIRQEKTRTGVYGSAVAQVIIKDGKFKALAGTSSSPTGTSNIDDQEELTELSGGYFPTFNQLALHTSYDRTLRELTSADPEYAEGYRYQVVPGPTVAHTRVGGTDYNFSMMQGAIRFARRQSSEAVVSLLTDVPFYGPHKLVPTVANNRIILNLNNHVVTSLTSSDRFLTIDKPDMHFTVTDNSPEKGGIWNMEVNYASGNIYGLLAAHGELRMSGGAMYIKNTASGKTAVAFVSQNNPSTTSNLVIEGGTMTAPRGLISNAGGVTTITGGKCHFDVNISGTVNGTLAITGGYYLNDGRGTASPLENYCVCPFDVEPTTTDDKAAVGTEYNFKVTDAYDSYGTSLDIVDYTPTSVTLNLNGYLSAETSKADWIIRANCTNYNKNNRDAKTRTLTLDISGLGIAPDDELRIVARSKTGTRESHRTYKMPYVFESDAVLPAGDYSSSILYVRAGKLTINNDVTADKVIVCPGAQIDVAHGTLTASTLVLRTSAWSSAAISGSFSAATYYTRIGPDGSDAYPATHFYPFGLPYGSSVADVRLSNELTPEYENTWVMKYYDEPERATQATANVDDGLHWKPITASATIGGGVGYELFSSLSYYREYYFPVTPTDTKKVSVTRTGDNKYHSGWNFVCSPLMSVYHNTSDPVTGLKVSWPQPDGSYDQEWPEYIWPAMTFACQVPESGSLDFSSSDLKIAAPRRYAAAEIPTEWIHLYIKDAENRGDQTSLFVHPSRFMDEYETGIDVAKQSFTASRALLYTEQTYGAMAFAGIADEVLQQGVPLTVFSPAEQELTLSMRDNGWLGRMEHVWLIDHEDNSRTDLLASDYTFAAAAGTIINRFTIEGAFKKQETAEGVEDKGARKEESRKMLVDGKLRIVVNDRMYDATGKLICEQ